VSHSDNPILPASYFAPAGRSKPTELQRQVTACLRHPVVELVLDLVDSYVLVLNEHRQIVVANNELLEALAVEAPSSCQGQRAGEILGCTHVPEGPDGCGTSKACCRCGAVLAVLAAQSLDEPVSRECHLDRYASGWWRPCDFRVKATPFTCEGERFTVTVLQDIGAEKKARQLEGMFLHDLHNTVQGLHGWSELLLETEGDTRRAAEHIRLLAESLSDEVQQQQMLLRAETRELVAHLENVYVQEVMERLDRTLARHPCRQAHSLEWSPVGEDESLQTDPVVLHRVLLNMAVNALEASVPGDSVRIWFEWREGRPCFFVHNLGVIPEVVQPRIFQRSFSTKGRKGRGLGTYSMKFLGENILRGEVGFESTQERGTCFHIYLPR